MRQRCVLAAPVLASASIFSICMAIFATRIDGMENVFALEQDSTGETSPCTSRIFGMCKGRRIRAYLPALLSSAFGNGNSTQLGDAGQKNNTSDPKQHAEKGGGQTQTNQAISDAREWILKASCPEAIENSTEPNLKTARHIRLARSSGNSKNSQIRLMCVTFAHQKRHDRVRAEKETWAKRCDGYLASSDSTDASISAVNISHAGKEDYYNMWQKTRSTIKYVHEHHRSNYDWFYFAGDDVYVFVENLKAYLASDNFTLAAGENHTTSTPMLVGGLMRGRRAEYVFGGSGYLLNRASLDLFADKIFPSCSVDERTDAEDLLITKCMRKFGARIPATLDYKQRSRFARFSPQIYWYSSSVLNCVF
jgi:hypothetical protein